VTCGSAMCKLLEWERLFCGSDRHQRCSREYTRGFWAVMRLSRCDIWSVGTITSCCGGWRMGASPSRAVAPWRVTGCSRQGASR
jgi:hypothetical protein